MDYKIRYKNSVAKDLQSIEKKYKTQILDRIDDSLASKPQKYPILKGRFLGLRKMRVGNYRVIYTILNDEVLILRVGHRREVYR